MDPRVAVVDTNVVVAGLLTADPQSPVARVLDGMLSAAFAYAISEALLAEYHDVLRRPRLRRLHGLDLGETEQLLTDLAQHAIVLRPADGPPAPEPGDQMLWDLLAAHERLVLVTGDKRLLQSGSMPGRVVTPAAFLAAP